MRDPESPRKQCSMELKKLIIDATNTLLPTELKHFKTPVAEVKRFEPITKYF